jgi:hypothetical protein
VAHKPSDVGRLPQRPWSKPLKRRSYLYQRVVKSLGHCERRDVIHLLIDGERTALPVGPRIRQCFRGASGAVLKKIAWRRREALEANTALRSIVWRDSAGRYEGFSRG